MSMFLTHFPRSELILTHCQSFHMRTLFLQAHRNRTRLKLVYFYFDDSLIPTSFTYFAGLTTSYRIPNDVSRSFAPHGCSSRSSSRYERHGGGGGDGDGDGVLSDENFPIRGSFVIPQRVMFCSANIYSENCPCWQSWHNPPKLPCEIERLGLLNKLIDRHRPTATAMHMGSLGTSRGKYRVRPSADRQIWRLRGYPRVEFLVFLSPGPGWTDW